MATAEFMAMKRQAWDEAMLLLVYELGQPEGEQLLAAVIREATDATARLKEHGEIVAGDSDD